MSINLSACARRYFRDHCGGPSQRVTGFIHRDNNALAVYFASCYHHGGHEVWIDVVLSRDPLVRDHIYGPGATLDVD